jgi:MFS superfamily sulfate permease-like transporter
MPVRQITAGGELSVLGSLPGLRAVRSYRRAWLARDVVAGVVLSTLLVPQGMAYAELAGLPPITGLYTSICACSATRSSGRRGSWCSARTRRSGR